MKKYIIGLIVIVSISLIGFRIYSKINNSAETVVETKPITVEGEKVRKGMIGDYAILNGTIEAEQTVTILPTIPAIVNKVAVEVGDEVKEGDLLFQLETEDVQNQVTQANVGVKSAQEVAKQAQAAYDMAKANYDMGYEQYLFSRENLAKYEQLYKEGIISEVEIKQMKLQASESTLELLKKQLEQAEISRNQAMLGIDSANTVYNTAADTLSDTTYTAPISGFVSSINVVESMFASSAQPAMVIHAIDRVHINVNVTETLVNKLTKGQEVDVVISSLGDKSVKGTLKTVSPAADAMSKLYAITIEVLNDNHEIKPGMFANVKLRTDEKNNTFYVKSEAVSFEEGKNFVYIEKENNTIERIEVEIGIDNGEFVEIMKGLEEDDIYIYKGVGFLQEDSVITMVRGDQ